MPIATLKDATSSASRHVSNRSGKELRSPVIGLKSATSSFLIATRSKENGRTMEHRSSTIALLQLDNEIRTVLPLTYRKQTIEASPARQFFRGSGVSAKLRPSLPFGWACQPLHWREGSRQKTGISQLSFYRVNSPSVICDSLVISVASSALYSFDSRSFVRAI
jgi:hypothetical protein